MKKTNGAVRDTHATRINSFLPEEKLAPRTCRLAQPANAAPRGEAGEVGVEVSVAVLVPEAPRKARRAGLSNQKGMKSTLKCTEPVKNVRITLKI